jgi:hypothetical protein
LCALQNFIQEIDHNEGAIPTDPYQAAYTPFPLILAMMMVVVSLQRMMRRKIQRLSYGGKILPMKCGKAT